VKGEVYISPEQPFLVLLDVAWDGPGKMMCPTKKRSTVVNSLAGTLIFIFYFKIFSIF
jgi:hypothetical protein